MINILEKTNKIEMNETVRQYVKNYPRALEIVTNRGEFDIRAYTIDPA